MATAKTKTLLLGLLLTTLLVATAAMSVTIYNPATLSVDVVVGGNQPSGDGDGDDDYNVVNVSATITTVNLTSSEQDIHIKTDEGHETDLHVQDGDVFVLLPNLNGEGSMALKVPFHPASLRLTPPAPK